MTLAVAWIAFPLLLGALSLGCGLFVERVAGVPLPGAIRIPVGFVVVSLVAYLAVIIGPAVTFAAPAVVALAVIGYGLALSEHMPRIRLDAGPMVLAAAGVYAVFAAPAVLTGSATFLGYIKLDDTATYLAMLDRVMQHGYNVAGLAPSTYQATLDTSLAYGYPLGALLPLGIGHVLIGTDGAWLWQPYVSFLAVMIALCIYQLTAGVLRSAWLRALVGFAGAQAALLYGYALWGGIKELDTAMLIALGATLAAGTESMLDRPRAVIPLAATSAAFLGALSVAGAVWLAPLLLVAIAIALARQWKRALLVAAAYLFTTGVFSIPAIVAGRTWLSHTGAFTGGTEYANLSRKLKISQVVGIWPSGDFRVGPLQPIATDVLLAVAAAGVLVGLFVAIRQRASAPIAAAASALVGCAVYVEYGSPWIGAKALASASPIVLSLGLAGCAILVERGDGRRIVGGVALGAVLAGVLWSNVLQYHGADIAPTGALSELESIGKEFAGQGPTLLTSYQTYGARHFLRSMAAEAASDLRSQLDLLRTGQTAPTGVSPDIDELTLDSVLYYRTLVLARSPLESRPPSVYSLVESGRYWDVWQRPDVFASIAAHVSLGSRYVPASVPSCGRILAVASLAAAHGGVVAAVERPPAVVVETTGTQGPPTSLGAYGEDVNALYLTKRYTVSAPFTVGAGGVYSVWIGGSSRGEATATVDGRRIGSERGVNQWPGNVNFVGNIPLALGTHTFLLQYGGSSWRPGSSGIPEFGLGPIAIGIGTESWPVTYVAPSQARTLCGKNLDWIEAVDRS